ncbi:MAG: hypothetical protein V4690_01200 [Patescibacteria group bacterium]
MKKNIVQDVLPPKKSIRNVEIPRVSKKSAPAPAPEPKPKTQDIVRKSVPKITIVKEEKKEVPKNNFEYNEPVRKSKSRFTRYILLGALLFGLVFFVSSFFKSAEITFSPKQETRVLNEVLSAEKNLASGGLGFQIVSTAKDIERTVTATGEERVDTKASGTIVIYNKTAEAQRLVATTRFEAAGGLIYRAKTAVTVPARQVKDGKTVSGSAEVVVEADAVGEKYNIPLSDLTIVGFKGTPKYTEIYARSKTAMTGGFSGVQKTVSKEVLDKAGAEMEQELQAALATEIASQIPNNFVLYQSSVSYKFEPVTQTGGGSTSSAVLKKRGVISAIIFDRTAISGVILQKILPDTEQGSVKISNLDVLDFTLNTVNFDPNTTDNISFNIKGDANVVWVFDEGKIKTDLLGLSKQSAEEVLRTYVNMKEAWIKTQPFWSRSIPNNPDKVEIVNTLEN